MISPYALTAVVHGEHRIDVDLTKQQVEDSPSLDDDKLADRLQRDGIASFVASWTHFVERLSKRGIAAAAR